MTRLTLVMRLKISEVFHKAGNSWGGKIQPISNRKFDPDMVHGRFKT